MGQEISFSIPVFAIYSNTENYVWGIILFEAEECRIILLEAGSLTQRLCVGNNFVLAELPKLSYILQYGAHNSRSLPSSSVEEARGLRTSPC